MSIKIRDDGFNNFAVESVGTADLTAGGGKVTLPKGASVDACTIEEQDAGSSDAGEMVNWIYSYNGQRVGNLLMTKENAAKYKKELEGAKKTESAASKDTASSGKTEKTGEKDADTVKENSGQNGELDGETFRLAIYVLGGVVAAGILAIIITLAVRRRKLKKKIQAADEAYINEQKDSPAGLPVDAEALAVAEKAEKEEKSENAGADTADGGEDSLQSDGESGNPADGSAGGAETEAEASPVSSNEGTDTPAVDENASDVIGEFSFGAPAQSGEENSGMNGTGN